MSRSFHRFCWRFAKSAVLTIAFLASGYSQSDAQAESARAWGEGVVLVSSLASQTPTEPHVKPLAKTAGFKYGKIVTLASDQSPGTIVISPKRNLLFLILGDGLAVQYRVATAKQGFEWVGVHQITSKVKWPDWRPPAEMRQRRPDLPAFMAGGPENPLGSRALYLGSSIYRIHGTNEPKSIGQAASSGCIRMHNAHIEELFQKVTNGTKVVML
jgi:lipoprotein-anchoring transpeptidase ErfK/SrfK